MARPGPPETADGLLQSGVDYFLNGQMREAATVFQRVLALDPTNEQAQIYLRNMLRPTASDLSQPPPGAVETGWDDGPVFQPRVAVDLSPPRDTPPTRANPSTARTLAPEPRSGFSTARTLAPETATPRPVSSGARPTPRPSVAPAPRNPVPALLKEARAAAELGDFTGAVERCDRVLEIEPNSAPAQALREQAAATLIQMYESHLGGVAGVPEVIADPAEIIWLSLDSRAAFVLAQIDGQVSYDDLYSICGMTQLDTSRILAQLLDQKAIRTKLGRSPHSR